MTHPPTEEAPDISGLTESVPNEKKASQLLAATEDLRAGAGKAFADCKIGLSISDSPDLAAKGLGKVHLQDALVEVSRYLLSNGGSLVYGGDLRPKGNTELLFGLTKLYNLPGYTGLRVYNYEAWPIHLSLTEDFQVKYSEEVEFVKVAAPEEFRGDTTVFLAPDTPQNRFIWARSLTKMRAAMNAATNARVFLGGQLTGYKGAYPGLLEELLLALEAEQPVYLVGAFGGVTEKLIQVILTQSTDPFDYWQEPRTEEEREFREFYNSQLPSNPINFQSQADRLLKFNLQRLSKVNGLSEEENQILFTTNHLFEIIHLIMKGLSRKLRLL